MNDFTKLIEECIKADQNNSVENKLLKLGEEVGELNRAWLALVGANNASRDANKNEVEVMEEAIDVFIVIYDIIRNLEKKLNISQDKTEKILEKKIKKWYKKIQSKK